MKCPRCGRELQGGPCATPGCLGSRPKSPTDSSQFPIIDLGTADIVLPGSEFERASTEIVAVDRASLAGAKEAAPRVVLGRRGSADGSPRAPQAAPVPAGRTSLTPPGATRCPKCKMPFEGAVPSRCPSCRTRVQARASSTTRCPSCGKPNEVGATACTRCRATLGE